MFGPRPWNGNEARHGISVGRVRGNLREWKVSRERIQNLFRESFCRLEAAPRGLPRWKNFFPPIDFAPFIEYLNTVALFVTKEDTIKRFPMRAFENAFSNSPPTPFPQSSRAHVFKGKWNQFHIFEIIADIINSIVSIISDGTCRKINFSDSNSAAGYRFEVTL